MLLAHDATVPTGALLFLYGSVKTVSVAVATVSWDVLAQVTRNALLIESHCRVSWGVGVGVV
jgi:hypothetical protein